MYPEARSVLDVFDRQAALTPNAVAVIDSDARLTYAELRHRAEGLAASLAVAGAGADVVVALLAERTLAAIVGIVGILKAGGAYLPLNPRDPEGRLMEIVDDAGVSLIVSQGYASHRLTSEGREVVSLDVATRSARTFDGSIARPSGENLAAVVYTSGSTGKPKGVEIPHRAIMSRISNGYRPRRHDVQKAPLHVVAHFSDVLLPLVTGGPIIILPDDCLTSGRALAEFLQEFETTRMVFVPSQLAALADSESDAVNALARLDTVVVSGEPLSPSLVRTFKRLLPQVALVNAYGASEVAGLACMGEVVSPDDIHVGRPVDGCAMYVLDDHGRPVPPGACGEVYIGGAQVALGYRNDTSLTAERFILDPFARDGSVMYRTGDLAERLAGGRLRILGRRDFEVKIHGFRVNLNEVERALESVPAVRRAVAWYTNNGRQELQALVHVEPAATCDAAAIRMALSAVLTSYMVPSHLEFTDALPMLPNGKVDRLSLTQTRRTGDRCAADDEPPTTATEQTLVNIWEDLLESRRVNVNDDFFTLGGDSLNAVRFTLRAERKGLDVTVEDLENSRSIRELAALVDERLLLMSASTREDVTP